MWTLKPNSNIHVSCAPQQSTKPRQGQDVYLSSAGSFEKTIADKQTFLHTVPVKMKPNAAPITLAIVSLISAFTSAAYADEKLSSLQTALAPNTISGYVSDEISIPAGNTAFSVFQPQQRIYGRQGLLSPFSRRSRNDGASFLPVPPINSSGLEITAATFSLINVSIQIHLLNLQSFQPIIGEVNFITGVNYRENSSGAEMMEASHLKAWNDEPMLSLLPPTPIEDSLSEVPPIIQASQPSSLIVEAVPEPASLALGSLSLGLIAAMRFCRNKN
jgi:hypothetical protein